MSAWSRSRSGSTPTWRSSRPRSPASSAPSPGFDRKLAVAMNTVAGLALTREFDPSGRASKGNPWPYHRAALERMLAG